MIFCIKIEMLFDLKTIGIILIFNIVLFGIATHVSYGQVGVPKPIEALKMPLVSTVIFILLETLFRNIYHRHPENTLWSSGQPKDTLFCIIFWILGCGAPFFMFLM